MEKACPLAESAPENVVVENNARGSNDELQREHGNRPVKIIPMNPMKTGIVDDAGVVQAAGGKVIIINKTKYPESAMQCEFNGSMQRYP